MINRKISGFQRFSISKKIIAGFAWAPIQIINPSYVMFITINTSKS